MASFEEAVVKLLIKEGGAKISNHKADAGGLTKYGISSRAYPNIDIAKLTEAAAKKIYLKDYWKPLDIDDQAQEYAETLFELAVNSGVGTAQRLKAASSNPLNSVEQAIIQLKFAQVARYAYICNKNKSQRVFLLGWLNRILND